MPTRKELIERAVMEATARANAKAIQDQYRAHKLRKSVEKKITQRKSAKKIQDMYKRWALRKASRGENIRSHFLKKLERECLEMSDGVSTESFYDMSLDDIRNVYPMGDKVQGKQRCYSYQTLKNLHDTDQWRDPFTRKKWAEYDWEWINRINSLLESNPLLKAAFQNDLVTLKKFVKTYGMSIVNETKEGTTVLLDFLEFGWRERDEVKLLESVEYLTSIMSQKAIDFQNSAGETALHKAARLWNRPVIQYLLSKMSANAINAQDKQGYTALHSILFGYDDDELTGEEETKVLEMVKSVTKAMSKKAILIQDYYGKTALDYAGGKSKAYLKKVFKMLKNQN